MRQPPVKGRSRLKTLVHQHERQHPRIPMRLATLNVVTLTARGHELASRMSSRCAHVCCIQETRWKGSKGAENGDGYKLMCHGTTDRNGVGIVISEALRNHVTSITCIGVT
ncbi:hypothetical protein Aduo_009267 [Ancylostoma duodenale]